MRFLAYFRPGDWLTLLLGVALTLWLASNLWSQARPQKVLIRSGGQLVAEERLDQARHIRVLGPLGESIVEIHQGRVRVAADPSPRQLCVRQGWLLHVGDAALCLPNQLSVELAGVTRRYDSLSY